MEKSKTKRLTLNGKKHRLSDSPKTPLSRNKSSIISSIESPSTPKSVKHNLINNTEYDHSPSNDEYITASQAAMSNYRDVIWKWNDDSIGSSNVKSPINHKPPVFNREKRERITPTLLRQIEPKIDKTKGFYKFQKLLLGEGANVKNLINSFNTETQQKTNTSLESSNNQISVKNSETESNTIIETTIETCREPHLDSTINQNFDINFSDEDELNSAVVIENETSLNVFDDCDFSLIKENYETLHKPNTTIKEKCDEDFLNLLDDSECELLAECTQVVEKSLKKILNPLDVQLESCEFNNSDNPTKKPVPKNDEKKQSISPATNTTDLFDRSLLDVSNCTFDSDFRTKVKTTELQLQKSPKTHEYLTNQTTLYSNLPQQKSQFSRHKSMPSPTILLTNKSIATKNKNFSRLPSSDCISLDFNSLSTLKNKTNSSLSLGSSFEFCETEGKRKLLKEELERKKLEAQQRLRRKQLARQQKEAWALKNAQKFSQK